MSAFAFDGLGARAQHRVRAARYMAVSLVCAGCCVVGGASVGAGVHQAQGADMFEQLALEMKVCSRVTDAINNRTKLLKPPLTLPPASAYSPLQGNATAAAVALVSQAATGAPCATRPAVFLSNVSIHLTFRSSFRQGAKSVRVYRRWAVGGGGGSRHCRRWLPGCFRMQHAPPQHNAAQHHSVVQIQEIPFAN